MSFWGLARIGEVLRSSRGCLLLPKDTLHACADRTFLHYHNPKSRRRGGAIHQHSLVRGEALANLLNFIFGHLKPKDMLYPFSPSTFRNRWDRFLRALQIPAKTGLLPGGLRGGGAVASYMCDLPIQDIMWRMRVRQTSTLEHYLQEVAAVVSLQDIPKHATDEITKCAALFDTILKSFGTQ